MQSHCKSSGEKRISIFLSSLSGGGAEKMMLRLAEEIAACGHTVDLVLAKYRGEYISVVPGNVNVVKLNARVFYSCFVPLVRYLRRVRPYVLLSTLEHVNIFAVLARLVARVETRNVIRIANTLSEEHRSLGAIRRAILSLFVKWVYPQSSWIIAVSNGVARDLVESYGLPRRKVCVIYNPAYHPRILQLAKQFPDHRWFRESRVPIIISVGRLQKQKDFATLIRAFVLLRGQLNARLLILGEGGERQNLEQLVYQLGVAGDVDMPGFVLNPYCYMARARVLVLSSLFEGFPNVLVEAMAVGVPVVSTECPSGPREILGNGDYGRLVKIGDAEQMADALLELLDKPTDERKLRERATDFRCDKIVREYLQVLLSSGRPASERRE